MNVELAQHFVGSANVFGKVGSGKVHCENAHNLKETIGGEENFMHRLNLQMDDQIYRDCIRGELCE